MLPVIKHARARLPAACLCRKRRAYGLNAELPDGVVHQHHAVLHTHPDVPVGPAALVRPVLVALLLRGKRANRRPVGGAFVTSPPRPGRGHRPRTPPAPGTQPSEAGAACLHLTMLVTARLRPESGPSDASVTHPLTSHTHCLDRRAELLYRAGDPRGSGLTWVGLRQAPEDKRAPQTLPIGFGGSLFELNLHPTHPLWKSHGLVS